MIEDETGSDWTLAEGVTGSTSSDYGDVLPEKQHSATSLVSEEKAGHKHPPSRDALIAKASKPLEVYRKVPETVYHVIVVGGFRVGKTTFLRMVDRVFARRPGCTTSIAEGGEVVTVSFLDSLASGRHTFEFREKHVSDKTGDIDVTNVLAYISNRQKEYRDVDQDPERLMPMSEIADARVDLCLWLLPPQEPTSTEVNLISAVWERLPVIPVISKADLLDTRELKEIRSNVAACLQHFHRHFSKDGLVNLQDLLKRAGAPASGVFSVINSISMDKSITSCGWPVKVYPWGSVEPLLHSDLPTLLSFIVEKLPQTLKLETEVRYHASLKVPQGDAGLLATSRIALADRGGTRPVTAPNPCSGQGTHTVRFPSPTGEDVVRPFSAGFDAGGRSWEIGAAVTPHTLVAELLRPVPSRDLGEQYSIDHDMFVSATFKLTIFGRLFQQKLVQKYKLCGSKWELLEGEKTIRKASQGLWDEIPVSIDIEFKWKPRADD